MDQIKTYISKTRSGHYCVTICKVGSTWPVFKKNKIGSIDSARAIAKAFIDSQEV